MASNGLPCARARRALGRFVSFHVLVPGEWTVRRGHDLLELIEQDIRVAQPLTTLFTHLEPVEDPRAFEDTGLDRPV
jgi:divalent metal cation (Fe/Co/Zn/Cd) transporter